MKKYIVRVGFMCFLISCGIPKKASENAGSFREIKTLINQKNFFKAKKLFFSQQHKIPTKDRLVIKGILNSAFNKPRAANKTIERVLTTSKKSLSDSAIVNLLVLQYRNYGKLGEYKKAFHSAKTILEEHSHWLSQEKEKEYQNEMKIWAMLFEVPKQKINIPETNVMNIWRDKADLPNLEVNKGVDTIRFVFDTGANFSTVTETTAKKMDMELLEGTIEVGGVTGNTILSKLAVCPFFSIGNIQVENAVFLVFPDSALAFPSIDYQIHGIIGFPVIEALKEIHITQSDKFIVPKTYTNFQKQNLAMDFLTPIIQLGQEYYSFDSGASHTQLYQKYYKKHKDSIHKNYKKIELKYAGAGGAISKEGFYVEFSSKIQGKKIQLDSVQVFPKIQKDFYGNIGQDFLHHFDKIILNFDKMFVVFE